MVGFHLTIRALESLVYVFKFEDDLANFRNGAGARVRE